LDALRKALIDHDPADLALLLPPQARAAAIDRTDEDDWVLVDGIQYQRARPHVRKIKGQYSASAEGQG